MEADYQRKGLGRHLCQLLELSARKNSMRAMMLLVPSGLAGVPGRSFVTRSSRGSPASTTVGTREAACRRAAVLVAQVPAKSRDRARG